MIYRLGHREDVEDVLAHVKPPKYLVQAGLRLVEH